jgi:hypothetical protein
MSKQEPHHAGDEVSSENENDEGTPKGDHHDA